MAINNRKIVLVERITDGRTYGTLNNNAEIPEELVAYADNEHMHRVGARLPMDVSAAENAGLESSVIASSDEDGIYIELPHGMYRETDDPDMPYVVSLQHSYDLKPTHVYGEYYRVQMRCAAIEDMTLRKKLEDGQDGHFVTKGWKEGYHVPIESVAITIDLRDYFIRVSDLQRQDPDTGIEPRYDIYANVGTENEYCVCQSLVDALMSPLVFHYRGTRGNIQGKVMLTTWIPDGYDEECLEHLVISDFSSVTRASTLSELKTLTLESRMYGHTMSLGEYEVVFTECPMGVEVEYVDYEEVTLKFPSPRNTSYIWTKHIEPLNDVSDAPLATEDMVGTYDIVNGDGITAYVNTNTSIGQVHRLYPGQSLKITGDCRYVKDSVSGESLWYEFIPSSSIVPLWMDNDMYARLSKVETFTDRAAIYIGTDYMQQETLEKVIVVRGAKQDGEYVTYYYVPFDGSRNIISSDKEYGMLDGEDVETSDLYDNAARFAFMVKTPENMDGLAFVDGQTNSYDPVTINEFYETSDGERKFVVINEPEFLKGIYEVTDINTATAKS